MVLPRGIEPEHGIDRRSIGQHLRAVRAARSAVSSAEPQRSPDSKTGVLPLDDRKIEMVVLDSNRRRDPRRCEPVVLMRGIEPTITELKARWTGRCPT